MPPSSVREQWGALFEPLRRAFDAADAAGFVASLDAISGVRERELWQALRQLDERLRAALDQFRFDPRLQRLAETDMPDARARLDHVLKLTEEAAHRTMDLVERSAPLAASAAAGAAQLAGECERVRTRIAPEIRELWARLEGYLGATQRDGETIRANLTEVLMAQGYQDLSGQIIRRVIELVAQLERELARLVQLADGDASDNRLATSTGEDLARGIGPAVPGVSAGIVNGQQDVDDLLALGAEVNGVAAGV